MSKEIRITGSIARAIQVVLWIQQGAIEGIPQPCWGNFTFFGRIEPGEVIRSSRIQPSSDCIGVWQLKREVKLYFRNLVAIVYMKGMKLDGGRKHGYDTSLDGNGTMWNVDHVKYSPNSDQDRQVPISQWHDYDPGYVGLCSFPV